MTQTLEQMDEHMRASISQTYDVPIKHIKLLEIGQLAETLTDTGIRPLDVIGNLAYSLCQINDPNKRKEALNISLQALEKYLQYKIDTARTQGQTAQEAVFGTNGAALGIIRLINRHGIESLRDYVANGRPSQLAA